MPALKPYGGYVRKLVLAFDVGTTFSGIGYAILDPGEVPQIQAVTRFPAQEKGDFKIPTVLYYTQDGNVRAAGAEACSSEMELIAEDEDLILVEWFKLHLRPDAMKHDPGLGSMPSLPAKKTAIDVFADFLRYLFTCAQKYIIDTHPNGESLWNSVKNHIDVVLSHPNGWEGPQQASMRTAAVSAGLVPDTTVGHERVHFVTEGEASLHYCINSGLAADAVQPGKSVMVVDAGGGTVDLSTYYFTEIAPVTVEEIAPTDCIFQGSTRVNVRARNFLEEKLKGSKYGHELDIKAMLQHFERSVKPTFKDSKERSFIKFGTARDKDPQLGIRNGQLVLEGCEMAGFFESSVEAIVEAVRGQRSSASKPVSQALLVGGYAASPWLFARLKDLLGNMDMQLSRPDSHTNKAVAAGAISYYLGNIVSARITRFAYGTDCTAPYNPHNPEHLARSGTIIALSSGKLAVPGRFATILEKGKRICDQQEHTKAFFREASYAPTLNKVDAEIICYRGTSKSPQWVDEEPERFSALCKIFADTSLVSKVERSGPTGVYYQQQFQVVLSCGLTEMKAQISWIENGIEKRGPAKVVYDDDAVAWRTD